MTGVELAVEAELSRPEKFPAGIVDCGNTTGGDTKGGTSTVVAASEVAGAAAAGLTKFAVSTMTTTAVTIPETDRTRRKATPSDAPGASIHCWVDKLVQVSGILTSRAIPNRKNSWNICQDEGPTDGSRAMTGTT